MDYSTLKQQIVKDIEQSSDANFKALKQLIQQEKANYQTAAEFSKVFGDKVSESVIKNIADGIPDDELGTFANECLAPVYRQAQDTMLNACKNIQKIYNKQEGIELNPVDVKRDESRITHIAERFNKAENFEKVKFLTNSNTTRSITRGAVQDSMRANSKFHEDVGLNIRISRSDGSGCCDWCASVVGTYTSFDSLPDNFWAIHRGCSCVIDYRVGRTRNKIKFNTDERGNLSKVTEEILQNTNENDIIIHKSVGAKFRNYEVELPTGEITQFTEGTRITNTKTIAGNGRERQIDEVDILVSKYGGQADLWEKKKGIGYLDYEGESYKAEVHWYEEPTVGRHKFKAKSYNGNWIIDE